ncbi:TPA: (2Fe-2S)-binding protein [bacterium]|nr:MAG: (2Fe-2S)-binding protein [Candidatus Hydrogenedentes bacterium CG1_02_42_14]PIU48722.1 MAG: (2Fe-2S)-binding protein [Candidatus Hydrogenedentes bacterium CG07_land_8_20_14_0_80_42_17]HBW47801.1 (2Fe-2S)-binding protein [bacterium]
MKTIKVFVNGERYTRNIPEHITLLRFIRDELGLIGTKEGCGAGECGACTVTMNGRAVNSCMVLAVEADGARIETVEGETASTKPSKLQELFEEHHAVQCGFCTAGMIMSIKELLKNNPKPSVEEIKQGIEGNLCRCTGYQQIVEAVLDYTGQLESPGELKIVR